MSIDTSLSNIGTTANDYMQPKFYNYSGGLSFGLWIGFAVCLYSCFAGFGAFYIDQRREVKDQALPQTVTFFQNISTIG